ncbi:MAG: hypothetical protein ACI4J0_08560 [Huintestinicola sp.]|uniref:hypothetical protein n=1 Tax=Huintestinicola sp. TaxID=2981661 RepID=UPI003F0DD8E5
MKKKNVKKVLITAAIFSAAFNMNACAYGPPEGDLDDNYSPSSNYNEDVYGPPEDYYDETESEQTEVSSEDGDTLTDLELDEMQAVDNAISELLNSDEYKSLSSEDERREAVTALITELAEKGTEEFPYPLINKSSVNTEGDVISFSYKCGALGGVMTGPFDPMMN